MMYVCMLPFYASMCLCVCVCVYVGPIVSEDSVRQLMEIMGVEQQVARTALIRFAGKGLGER